MAKKLFIGGISWNTGDAELKAAFEQFGEILEATVVTDRQTGRSRGFGFVTFVDDENALKAVSELDGTELDGRNIRVNEAHDKPQGGRGGGVAAAAVAAVAAAAGSSQPWPNSRPGL